MKAIIFGKYMYYYDKLPFGIISAPKHFHSRISEIFGRLAVAVSVIDGCLIFGKNLREHNENLALALEKVQKVELTLWPKLSMGQYFTQT